MMKGVRQKQNIENLCDTRSLQTSIEVGFSPAIDRVRQRSGRLPSRLSRPGKTENRNTVSQQAECSVRKTGSPGHNNTAAFLQLFRTDIIRPLRPFVCGTQFYSIHGE